MIDAGKYVSIIADAIKQDSKIMGMVDNQVIPGMVLKNCDPYLTKPKATCIGVQHLDLKSDAMPGFFIHGHSSNDHQIQVSVTNKSKTSTYAHQVAALVGTLLQKGIYINLGGITYNLNFRNPITVTETGDDVNQDRFHVILTARAYYLD